jgi:hypothetical protein
MDPFVGGGRVKVARRLSCIRGDRLTEQILFGLLGRIFLGRFGIFLVAVVQPGDATVQRLARTGASSLGHTHFSGRILDCFSRKMSSGSFATNMDPAPWLAAEVRTCAVQCIPLSWTRDAFGPFIVN